MSKNPFKIALFFLLLLSTNMIFAQEIGVSAAFSTSERDYFINSMGYQLDYNKIVKDKHKFGVSIHHLFSHFSGKEPNYPSLNDGKTYYREEESANQRLGIGTYFLFRIFSIKKSSLFIGPELSLNYYFYDKSIYQYPVEDPNNESNYDYTDVDLNKLGYGLKLNYFYKFSDNLSLQIAVKPEIAMFSSGGCLITINPSPWLHANMGLVYHFSKK